MLTLQPMTEEEYITYRAWLIEDYAREIADNDHISMEEAREISIRDIESAQAQGWATPNHFFYNIVLVTEDAATRLGYLCIEADSQKKRCFIDDIYLHEEFRHQGYGRKVLELLVTNMKAQGIHRIRLNVFGNNSIAQEFYKKMGYEFTNMHMLKRLDGG
jgi:ribosomal protein S18 acetylase RimI-like enzyme